MHWLPLLAVFAQLTTSQWDNARTSANLHETTLTPATVSSPQFGNRFSLKVDGDVYAQPLYIPHVAIPGKGTHNVLYVATEHDSVYAFDSDAPIDPLWHVSFLKPGSIGIVGDADVLCPFIHPEIGITSTPVIDLATGWSGRENRSASRGSVTRFSYALSSHLTR
jgi:hypothetical protein